MLSEVVPHTINETYGHLYCRPTVPIRIAQRTRLLLRKPVADPRRSTLPSSHAEDGNGDGVIMVVPLLGEDGEAVADLDSLS